MTTTIEFRLAALGVLLPTAAAPAANYLPYVLQDGMLYISGQLPIADGALTCRGKLGEGVSVEAGQEAARICAINILSQAQAALSGDLERLRKVVRITGFVAATPEFTEHHLVVNGASNFLAEALGERGRHARAAVGVAGLPLDAAVEIEAILAVS